MLRVDENRQIKVTNKEFVTFKHDNGMVTFFQPDEQIWIRTSITGLWVYKYIESNNCTLNELLQVICESSHLPIEEIKGDIEHFIIDMINCGFIKIEDTNPSIENTYKVTELNSCDLNELWIEVVSDKEVALNNSSQDQEFFPIENLEDVLTQAKLLDINYLTIAGKDPLLHPEFKQLLKKARSISDWNIKVRTTMQTDNLSNIDAMIDYADKIELVVAGVNEGIHDKIIGEGSFNRTIKLLEYLRQNIDNRKTKFGLLFVPLKENLDQMSLLLEMGYSNKVDFIHLNDVKSKEYYLQMKDDEREDFFKKSHGNFIKIVAKNISKHSLTKAKDAKKIKINDTFSPNFDLIKPLKKYNCEAGITKLAILENGDVFPCADLKNNTSSRLGNIFKGDQLSLLTQKSKEWNQEVFSVNREEKCRECNFRYYCGGGCRARTSSMNEKDLMCNGILDIYMDFFKNLETMEVDLEDKREHDYGRNKEKFQFKHCN